MSNSDSCYVEIVNPEIYTIAIETSVLCNINNIEIEKYNTTNLEIVNTNIILPSDIPDISVDKIIGLNQYLIDNLDIGKDGTYLKLAVIQNGIAQFFGEGFDLDQYLDYYAFDGGSP